MHIITTENINELQLQLLLMRWTPSEKYHGEVKHLKG
jgi:hypothetical protein